MINTSPKILILGPAPPYRGGISDTNYLLYKTLNKHGIKTFLWTFKVQYPSFLFPGKSQFLKDSHENFNRKIHSYSPWNWKKVAYEINVMQPEKVIFRYWTPFLAFCWSGITKFLNKNIEILGMVDNWIPHEKNILDSYMNKKFGKRCSRFVTFSDNVANNISKNFKNPLFCGFHPISNDLPAPISKNKAKEKLGLKKDVTYVLFTGLIRKYKGLNILIEAFSLKELREKNIELIVAGEFYDSLKKYKQIIDKLNLKNKIHIFPKYHSFKVLRDFFCASEIVALPYITASQSGIIPMAYFYKKPLLVSDVNGLKEIILEDKTGKVVPTNSKGFSESIINDFNIEKLKFYKKNIIDAISKYSWDSFIIKLIKFLNKKI